MVRGSLYTLFLFFICFFEASIDVVKQLLVLLDLSLSQPNRPWYSAAAHLALNEKNFISNCLSTSHQLPKHFLIFFQFLLQFFKLTQISILIFIFSLLFLYLLSFLLALFLHFLQLILVLSQLLNGFLNLFLVISIVRLDIRIGWSCIHLNIGLDHLVYHVLDAGVDVVDCFHVEGD